MFVACVYFFGYCWYKEYFVLLCVNMNNANAMICKSKQWLLSCCKIDVLDHMFVRIEKSKIESVYAMSFCTDFLIAKVQKYIIRYDFVTMF